MLTTIIKFIPGSRRGALRAFRVTQVKDGLRREYAVMAVNGIQAVQQARRMAEGAQ